jgi:hypothetical protein
MDTLSSQALRIADGAAVNGRDAARKYIERRALYLCAPRPVTFG